MNRLLNIFGTVHEQLGLQFNINGDKMNTLFLVIYQVRTNISIKGAIKFLEKDTEITISEDLSYQEENNSNWLSRLIVEIRISDDTIEKAITKAFMYVDGVVGLLSFQTGVTIDYPIFDRAIEISEDTKDRLFVQNCRLPYNLGTKRPLDLDEFQVFFQHLNRIDIPHIQKYPHRIERAIRWYRKGISEMDDISRFTQFWIGLEVLNPIISEKYHDNIAEDPQFYQPNDPKKLIQLNGLKFFFLKRINQTYDFWKNCIGFRKEIIHGIKPLEEIEENIRKNNPIVEEALQKAIFDCLNIPNEVIDKITHKSYSSSGNVEIRYSAILTDSLLNPNEMDLLPFFEVIPQLKMGETNENETAVEAHIQCQLKNFKGSYRLLYHELYGKIDPEINQRNNISSIAIQKD